MTDAPRPADPLTEEEVAAAWFDGYRAAVGDMHHRRPLLDATRAPRSDDLRAALTLLRETIIGNWRQRGLGYISDDARGMVLNEIDRALATSAPPSPDEIHP